MNGASPKGALRSAEFDDVYFSAENGLAETQHVFLAGNNLPAAWAGKADFVIGETGFGTGLNFLAVWHLFKQTRQAGQRLHFVSFEKFPLSRAQIEEALAVWRGDLAEEMDALLAHYPDQLLPGFHRIIVSSEMTLTVIFDDVNAAIGEMNAQVDAWFLDGFKPSSNPEMWSDIVFQNMARCSHKGTTLATFTAAGFVRRGLKAAGFAVEKVPGFGRKREMSIGRFTGGAS